MGQSVCRSLNTNFVGVVTSGNFTTVPDYTDLAGKADKDYVEAVDRSLRQSISTEATQRTNSDQQLQKQVQQVATELSAKADKQALKDVLSETSMARVKTMIESLLTQHLDNISKLCAKERAALEKDIAAFNNLAAGSNKELSAKLQPFREQFTQVLAKIDNIAAGAGSLPQLKTDMDKLAAKLADTQRKASDTLAAIEQKKDALSNYVQEQVRLAESRLMANLTSQLKTEKKKGFFARLFS